jgi:hypothetical protein
MGERQRLADLCRDLCAACERAERAGGDLVPIERDLGEAGTALAALDDLILATPAESLHDLALKAGLIGRLPAGCRHADETDALLQILLRDIERLAR